MTITSTLIYKISVSAVCSVCPTFHHCTDFDGFDCGFWFWVNFVAGFAVFDDFSSISNIAQCLPP